LLDIPLIGPTEAGHVYSGSRRVTDFSIVCSCIVVAGLVAGDSPSCYAMVCHATPCGVWMYYHRRTMYAPRGAKISSCRSASHLFSSYLFLFFFKKKRSRKQGATRLEPLTVETNSGAGP